MKNSEIRALTNEEIMNKIAEYKEAFENGDYASLGFDKNYGWDNFVRDYLGLLSEEKIIINLDSSLYEESLDEFKESLYLVEEVKDESGEVTTPIDALVQEKMEEIYNNYFNATAVGLKVYYDKNLDNKADEVTEGSPEALLATQLLQTIYAEAVKKKETITTALNDVILEYNLTNKNQNGIWKEFKTAGLKVKLISSASYNASSSNDEKIIEQKPLAIDYMNAGHVAWVMGDIQKAAVFYGKAITASGNRERFLEMFHKDEEALLTQGIREEDIPLMLDLL